MNEPLPAVYRHALAFYKKVEESAKVSDVGDVLAEVYMTSIYEELEISAPARVAVRELLFASDPPCLLLLERGAGGRPSVVALMREPTLTDLTGRATVSLADEKDIAERLARLEAWRLQFASLNIVEALRNHERRIVELEAKLAQQGESTNGTD